MPIPHTTFGAVAALTQISDRQPSHADVADIAVVIVNYNSGPYLSRCLRALERQTVKPAAIVLVDNASLDGSAEAALASVLDLAVDHVSFRENHGFAAGNNIAVRRTAAPWVATLNPDAFPKSDWLEQLVAARKRHPHVAMFASLQIDAADQQLLDGVGDCYLAFGFSWRGGKGYPVEAAPGECEVFSPCGAAALYRRDLFDQLGGFDERFFCYVEDVDLAFRARLSGERCVFVPDAVVYHVGGGSGGVDSAFALRHGARNRLWAYVKNMPAALFLLTLPGHIAASLMLIVTDVLSGRGFATLQGITEALLGMRPVWKSRQRIQSARTATTGEIARAFCWSLSRAARRMPAPIRLVRHGGAM